VVEPSTSVPVIVIVEPDVDAVLMPAPAIVKLPPLLLRVTVFVAVDSVCSSFVVDPSASVPVIVIVPPFDPVVSVIATMPAPAIVTAFPVVVLVVIVAVVPEPAPTPKIPSFEAEPSASVLVTVKFG